MLYRYMGIALYFLFLVFLSLVDIDATYVESYTLPNPPSDWVRELSLSPFARLHLNVALKQQNLNVLSEIFHNVSDPKSPRYGQYLTAEAIAHLVRPTSDHITLVRNWLSQYDVVITESLGQDYFHIKLSVQQAELMLQTKFQQYRHVVFNFTTIKSIGKYSVPNYLTDIIVMIDGVNNFPRFRRKKSINQLHGKGMDGNVNPKLVRSLYELDGIVGKSQRNSQAVIGFTPFDGFYNQKDQDMFFHEYFPDGKMKIKTMGQTIDPEKPGLETALDIQYITTTGNQVPTTVWERPGSDPDSGGCMVPYLWFLNNLTTMANPPLVNSISYEDYELGPYHVNTKYIMRCETEFQKAGVRGLSILFASGDDGVGGWDSDTCKSFIPHWPGASPYITSVGGTIPSRTDTDAEEVCWSESSGGFSTIFDTPDYQIAAVANYLQDATNLPPQSYWKRSGRGYPDISALGKNLEIIHKQKSRVVSGTSGSAPIWSGVIGLLNDLRVGNGKPALGFLNPWLYQTAQSHPECFGDPTEGSNPGCMTQGFYAAKGWDPCSGLGSPRYKCLSKVIKEMG